MNVWQSLMLLMISNGATGLHEIVRYDTRSDWESAIGGGPTWCVDFNYLTSDYKILDTFPGSTFQDTNGINRLIIRGNPVTSDIDSPTDPFASFPSGSIDGSTYAALYVDKETSTTVRLSFLDSNIRAWGAGFRGIDAEGLLVDIVSTQSTAVIVQEVTTLNNFNAFFGFTIDENLQTITFRAKTGNGLQNSGEQFALDNICAYLPGTPPTPAPPTPTPPTPTPPTDGCNVDIFIIGWIICFILDIFNVIF